MININNTKCDAVGIEETLAIGCIDHTTEEIEQVFCNRKDLSENDKLIYDNFFLLSNKKSFVSILNHPCVIGIDRMTNSDVKTESLELLYDELSLEEQSKIDNFLNMLLQMSQKD
jgi:hypothetical protein